MDSSIEIRESPRLLYRDVHDLQWMHRSMRSRSTPSAACSKLPCTSRLGPQPRKQLFCSDAGTVVFRQLPKLFFGWDRCNRNPSRRRKPSLGQQPTNELSRLVEELDDLRRTIGKKLRPSLFVNRNPDHGSPHSRSRTAFNSLPSACDPSQSDLVPQIGRRVLRALCGSNL